VWLRPDLGLTKDGSDKVSAWVNQGSVSATFSQATSTLQPLYLSTGGPGSQPCVQFNDDSLAAGTTQILNTGTAHTIIMIYKHDSFAASSDIIWGLEDNASAAATAPGFLYRNGTTKYEWSAKSGDWVSYVTGNISPGTTNWHKLRLEYNGSGATTLGNHNINYDGSDQTESSTAAGYCYKTLIGNYDSNGPGAAYAFYGRIAEFIVYSKALTTREKELLNKYLTRRYGI
jgi:hypothetical protein